MPGRSSTAFAAEPDAGVLSVGWQNGRPAPSRAGAARTGPRPIRRLTWRRLRNPTTAETSARPTTAKGWGTEAPDQPLKPMEFERRALRPDDVAIKITYAGICHSDLHQCRNDWGNSRYPVDPGPRDRRHRDRRRRRGHQAQGRRHRRGRQHRRQLHLTATNAWKAGSNSACSGSTLTYNGVDKVDGSDHQGRLFRPYRGARPFRLPDARRHRPGARLAFAVRRDHHLVAAAPISDMSVRGRRSRWPGSAGSATWASSSPHALGAHVTMITTTPEQGRGRPGARRRTTSSSRRDADADGGGRGPLRLHPRHHPGQP